MHDSYVRPFLTMLSGKIPAGTLKQGIAFPGLGRLCQHSGGLVDDEDLRVFVKDIEPAGRCAGAGPIGMVDRLRLRVNFQGWVQTGLTVHVHLALSHGCLSRRRDRPKSSRSACPAASMSFFPARIVPALLTQFVETGGIIGLERPIRPI